MIIVCLLCIPLEPEACSLEVQGVQRTPCNMARQTHKLHLIIAVGDRGAFVKFKDAA